MSSVFLPTQLSTLTAFSVVSDSTKMTNSNFLKQVELQTYLDSLKTDRLTEQQKSLYEAQVRLIEDELRAEKVYEC